MKISVFGIGYVGVVSATCLSSEGHSVIAVDVNQNKVDAIKEGRAPIVEPGLGSLLASCVEDGRLTATTDVDWAIDNSEMTLVCVGTPSQSNGSLDLRHVVRCCESIGTALSSKTSPHTIAVRSTMLPGSMSNVVVPVIQGAAGQRTSTNYYCIAYYPEFLREGSALRDYYEASTVVFGVSDPQTEYAMLQLVGQCSVDPFVTDYATAEAIKYASNAWHATKIVFSNEIGNFCKASGVDSHKVMDIICSDNRLNVSKAYMKPGFAFGGSCLPKDLRAILYQARTHDLRLPMLESLDTSNRAQIKKVFDFVEAAENRRVGLIGLSFKGETDDLRESPAVELAEMLYGKGYRLKIFDHNLVLSRIMGANRQYIDARIPHLAELLTSDLDDAIGFGETVVVSTKDMGGRRLPPLRPEQVLIDLVRLDDRPSGGKYCGLCW